MAESSDERNGAPEADETVPQVHSVLDGDVATVTVTGELTEAARRPLVRCMTDLLLSTPRLRALRLQFDDVPFMNSAGMAVLVQLQRMGAPRAVDVVLVDPPAIVARPLQLTGLWHRFPIEDTGDGEEDDGERG